MSLSPLVLDSSAWIEIFSSGKLSVRCEAELKNAPRVFVPTLSLFEVYKKIVKATSEDKALLAIALMSQHQVEDLSQEVALLAADLSMVHNLGMADSIILAHARSRSARLITLDNDFANIANVTILRA